MSLAETIQWLILGTFAFGLAFSIVFGFAVGLQIQNFIRGIASAWIPTILIFALGASTLVSGRNASLYGVTGNFLGAESSGYGVWILRICTATAVGLSTFVIAVTYLNKTPGPKASRPLFLAFCTYFTATYIVSGIFGTETSISYKTFYPFVIVYALYLTSNSDENVLLRLVRESLLIFLLAGLCLIVLKPSLVLQSNYPGFVPGMSSRYWGLASHANNVGPLAVFFSLIVAWLPYRRRVVTLFALTVAATTLLLSQSKTAIVAGTAVGGVLILRILFNAVFHKSSGRVSGLAALTCLMLGGVSFLAALVLDLLSRPMDAIFDRLQARGTLLTGREKIWSITMAEWEQSPLFGYGPNLWGDEFSARFGYYGIASNSHNQFFDTLGAAGILGVICLGIYILLLAVFAIRLANATKWLSLAFLTLLVMRGITEVPLKTINITTSDFFMHVVVIGLFMRTAMHLPTRQMHTTRSANSLVPAVPIRT